MDNRHYVEELRFVCEKAGDPVKARAMEAYMRHKFPFYGIQSVHRRAILKDFISTHDLPGKNDFIEIMKLLWAEPYREMQLMALDIFSKRKKYIDEHYPTFLEFLITTKSWWDTVDWLAGHPVGILFRKFPNVKTTYYERWKDSNDLWLNRTVILFQLFYKEETDEILLFETIDHFKKHNDFFIRKACGWALRQYSKINPASVKRFIEQTQNLSALTIKEGSKYLNN